MNRQQSRANKAMERKLSRRRQVKVGDIVEITLGRVVFDIKPGDDVSGDICYLCGKPATAWPGPKGMAHGAVIIDGQNFLLCEQCFTIAERTGHEAIIKKFWNAPDLKIEVGGTYESADQLRRDISDAAKKLKN
jgi:hypothetical protein